MPRSLPAVVLAISIAAHRTPLAGQEAPASLAVTVRDANGKALPRSLVTVTGASTAETDSVGRCVIAVPGAAPTQIRARKIGLERTDTTITLMPGERRELVLTLDSYEVGNARRTRAAGGDFTIDSIAQGSVHVETAGWFTFGTFSTRLLDQLVRERTTDVSTMVSGYSAGQALSLANLSARGQTSIQILAALGATGLTADSLARLNQRFALSLRDRRDVTLKVANAIWVDSSRKLAPVFASRVASMAPVPVHSVWLNRESGTAQINAWASGATEGKISVVLPKPFEDSTKFVVTNAIYLKAAWLVPFEKSRTIDRSFRSADGGVLHVPTMHDTRFLAYRRDSGWQAVRLPFRSGLTALYIILPDSGKALPPLLARFAVSGIPMPVANGAQREVELRLPRLHVEQELNLIPSMQRLGMRAAFDSGRADFTDLLSRVRDERLAVNLFKQQVFLDLDEEGAVAVAVSALGFVSITSSTPKPPPIHFFVDRPFLFVIQDERSQTTLFAGYIAKP